VGCPSENTIASLVDGTLRPEARAELSAHLAQCDACRELVATLAPGVPIAGSSDTRPARARTQQSLHHGRYLLEHVLGEGGMGVVYRAYDAQLRRPIALKVVRPDRMREESTGRVRERFLREAQAMAQLSHPHVVTVYDVGVDDDQIFVAMELVDGETLRTWRDKPRSLAEIGDVLDQAGRGLAAAHATGLVHRDFKPDNVLVRRDGRVQVSDFGLARRFDAEDAADAPGAPTSGPITGTLTATGATAGTPAYMSPEQWMGERASAASDQYSFCQVAWELFYGTRPHGDARDVGDLRARISSGTITAPARTAAPAEVERVLRRGLSRAPSDRFPQMTDLLSALASAMRSEVPARRRTRPGVFVAAGIVLAAAIAVPVVMRTTEDAPSSPTSNTAVPPTTPIVAPPPPAITQAATPTDSNPPPSPIVATPTKAPSASKPTSRARKDRNVERTTPTTTPAPPPPAPIDRPTKNVDRTDAVISDPWKLK
jgi:serine/threonine protein kinase